MLYLMTIITRGVLPRLSPIYIVKCKIYTYMYIYITYSQYCSVTSNNSLSHFPLSAIKTLQVSIPIVPDNVKLWENLVLNKYVHTKSLSRVTYSVFHAVYIILSFFIFICLPFSSVSKNKLLSKHFATTKRTHLTCSGTQHRSMTQQTK